MTRHVRLRLAESVLSAGLAASSLLFALDTTVNAQAGAFKTDHFRCYGTIAPVVNQQVELQDQFDSRIDPAFVEKVLVSEPVRFCNPVEKLDLATGIVTPILNKESHLTMYRMLPLGEDLAPTRKVTIQNQFGKKAIHIFGQEVIGVPTAKQEPTGEMPAFHDLDHFKCYRAYGAALNRRVTLRDQFRVEENVTVAYPFAYCNPTVKVHGGMTTEIQNKDDHLVCYKTTQQPFMHAPVNVRNQFVPPGQVLQLPFGRVDLLCVPSKQLKVSALTPS